MNHRATQGSVLIITLLTMVLVTAMIALIVRQSTADTRTAGTQAVLQQQEALARTGLSVARLAAFSSIHAQLNAVVNGTADYTTPAYYNSERTGGQGSVQALLEALQTEANDTLCDVGNPDGNSTGTLSVMVYFLPDSACPNGKLPPANLNIPPVTPLSTQNGGIQTYEVPFVITSEATLGGITKILTQPGAYRVTLGTGGINHYLLLARDTQNVTLDRNVPLDGPVHSNTVWWVSGRSWVGDVISSSGCQDGPSCGTPSADLGIKDGGNTERRSVAQLSPTPDAPCSGNFCPQFTAGVDYKAPTVAFPATTDVALAAASGGLTITGDVYEAVLDGRPDASGARQQLFRVCDETGACNTYRLNENGSLDRDIPGTKLFTPLLPDFNGIIYVDGTIQRLRAESSFAPAYNEAASFTLAARGDIRITSSLRSDRPACQTHITRNAEGQVQVAQCNDATDANIAALGLFSTEGNLIIGRVTDTGMTPSPDLTLHAALLAPNGTLVIEPPSGSTQILRLLGSFAGQTLPEITTDTYDILMDYDPRFGTEAKVKPRGFPVFNAAYLSATTQLGTERSLLAP